VYGSGDHIAFAIPRMLRNDFIDHDHARYFINAQLNRMDADEVLGLVHGILARAGDDITKGDRERIRYALERYPIEQIISSDAGTVGGLAPFLRQSLARVGPGALERAKPFLEYAERLDSHAPHDETTRELHDATIALVTEQLLRNAHITPHGSPVGFSNYEDFAVTGRINTNFDLLEMMAPST
jgi:hypothetical protein